MMERMTRQREAVWNALAQSGRPMSPGEILAAAQQSVPTMVLSTVYRNIRALVQDARVEAIVLPGQADRYAALTVDQTMALTVRTRSSGSSGAGGSSASCVSSDAPAMAEGAPAHHRHYFHCRQCDRVFPLEGCPGHLEEITPPGFEVDSHEITLLGRCAECASGAGKPAGRGPAGKSGSAVRRPHRH